MSIKIGHLSDLHYGPEHLDEVDRCTGYAIDRLIEQKCDVAVLSGDTTDKRLDLNSPATIALLRQVHRLANHCPVLILQGTASHEPPGTLEVFKTLGGRHPVYVADRIKQVALVKGTWLESADWRFDEAPDCEVLFSVLPSINKAAVAAVEPPAASAEAVGDYVYDLLKGWAANHLHARKRHIPTCLVSHGTVSGATTEQGVPMMGRDHEFTTGTLFAAEASAVLLGHIHKHQQWEHQGRRIAYPGSPGRLHFGELDDKGCLLWRVDAAESEAAFIETPAKTLLQLEFNGPPDMARLRLEAKQAHNAHVRIRWQIDEDCAHTIDREAITGLFSHAAQIKLEGRINPVQRHRAEGINRAGSLTEKLETWAEATDTPAAPLIERLRLLESDSVEDIVAQLLQTPDTPTNKAA